MYLTHKLKEKIFLSTLFSSPLELKQKFKTLRQDIPTIIK